MVKSVDIVNRLGETPAAAAGEDLLELVHTVMHQARARQYQALRSDGTLDLTHMEAKTLGFFARHPGSTQSDLVEHSGRDKAQLGRLIKGLRERGLLDATPDPADRRNVRLQPTPEGQRLVDALRRRVREVNAQAIAGLAPAECEQLRALLLRMKDNLQR